MNDFHLQPKSRTHELKIDPVFFDRIINGKKTFELRQNDRSFKAGDIVKLEEFSIKGYVCDVKGCKQTGEYSGSYVECEILGVFGNTEEDLEALRMFGIDLNGYVILSIKILKTELKYDSGREF